MQISSLELHAHLLRFFQALSIALEQRAGVRTVERALAAYRKTLSHSDLIFPPTLTCRNNAHPPFPSANKKEPVPCTEAHLALGSANHSHTWTPLPTMQGTYTHLYPNNRFLILAHSEDRQSTAFFRNTIVTANCVQELASFHA